MKNPSDPTGNQTANFQLRHPGNILERRVSQIIAHEFLCCYLTGLGVQCLLSKVLFY